MTKSERGLNFMFDDFNNQNSRGRVEENTELSPLDEFGKEKRPKETKSTYDSNHNQNKFGFNKNQSSDSGRGSWFSVGIAIAIIGFLGFLMFNGGDLLTESKRIIGTPNENLNVMKNSVVDLQTVNQKEGKYDDVKDKNKIFDESVLLNMPEKEYLIYIYTGKPELDKKFDAFVKKNQKDIPIYKFAYLDVNNNVDIKLEIENEFKPYLISVKDLGKGVKTIDATIDNEKQLKNVPEYFKDLVSEDTFTKTEVHQYNKNSKPDSDK